MFVKLLKWLAGLLVLAVIGLIGWLVVSPPALIRVATGYTAKTVCSNVFIAGRDPDEVLRVDVQAPGHWLLKYISLDVDRNAKTVGASLLGQFGESLTQARGGLGCTKLTGDERYRLAAVSLPAMTPPPSDAMWPDGGRVQPSQDPAIAKILDDPAMTGPGMRAVVVVHNGRILAERYGEGFSAETPLLGWSMTKTVNAAIVGTLVKAGSMSLNQSELRPEWKADGRAKITLADLLAMSSGLEFNEDYGDVTDVTRMLFLTPDMAAFTAAKPLTGEIGKVWNYSSGTATLISRLWQDALGGGAEALAWPSRKLFQPLGMSSAVLETDETGTFVGSSFMYATARDWARFGQFLLQVGVWNGNELLPSGFVDMMREAAPASNGAYTKGQAWIAGPGDEASPGAGAADGAPADTWWLEGHDGQTVAIAPSRRLVVVRLGLTPSRLGYRPQKLLGALANTLP
jgi:CubicO group peptidase (beta-lactamase class C family)